MFLSVLSILIIGNSSKLTFLALCATLLERVPIEEDSNMAGGRMTFERDQVVRILTLDGRISNEEYTVGHEKADRRGHITLQEVNTSRQVKVNQRRVLANCATGEVLVIQTGDKFRAVCPKCRSVVEVVPSDNSMGCQEHGTFPLHWKPGERPMADTTTEKKKPTKAVTKAAEKKPSPEKKQKAAKAALPVDLHALKSHKGVELWSKKVSFDHALIDVQAHILIFVSEPRKLCFNTYDSTLGRKAEPLPIDAFMAGEGKGWFPVADLEKAREKFIKDGYIKQ